MDLCGLENMKLLIRVHIFVISLPDRVNRSVHKFVFQNVNLE